MAGTYTNNWKNILTALMSKIKAEMKCPVFSDFDEVNKSNQFIKLIPNGSEQGDVTKFSEHRTFNIDIQYYIINRKDSQFQNHVLTQASILETLFHENPTLALADGSTAYNLMIGDLELNVEPEDELEDYFISGWTFTCEHLNIVGKGEYSIQSLAFDGANDYLEIGNKSDFNFGASTDFTVSLWAKYTGDGYMGLVSKGVGSTSGGWEVIINLNTGKLQGRIEDSDGSPTLDAISTGEYNDGAWHNFVVVFDRSALMTLYIDGNVDGGLGSGTVDISSGGDCDATHSLIIGRQSVGSTYYTGSIDEVSIWDTVLTQSAITELYNSGKPKDIRLGTFKHLFDSNCKGYWRMGDGALDDFSLIADQTNPTLGAEETTNGDFSNSGVISTSSWSLGWYRAGGNLGSSIADGELILTSDAGEDEFYTRVYATDGTSSLDFLTQGATYKLTYTVSGITGSPTLQYYAGSYITAVQSIGTHTVYIRNNTNQLFIFVNYTTNGSTIKLSDVSVKRVNGNPGLMTNMTSADIETETP